MKMYAITGYVQKKCYYSFHVTAADHCHARIKGELELNKMREGEGSTQVLSVTKCNDLFR